MPDVNILINAQNKASGPIKQVGDDIGGLDKKATNAVKGGLGALGGVLGTGLKVAAGIGAAALVGIGTAVGVTGTQFNNMRQQAQIAFTTMLGSGGQAKAFLDDLQKFPASTPFEFPELVAASQKMLAMGFAAEEVKPTLTAIGDAVAGLGGGGEMIGRVTTALGQMQAKGKASAEEMMQITEAGIPGWEFLAKKIGVDIPTAMDMVSEGAVSADTAIGALVDGMTGKFGGLMAAQSKTFGGLFSTVKDTFTQVSGQVMTPFFERMTEGLQMIVDWTSSPAFTDGVAQLTRWLEMAAQAASVFFKDLLGGQPILDAVSHGLRILLPPSVFLVWEDFADILRGVTSIIGGLWDIVVRGQAPLGDWFVMWGRINDLLGFAAGDTLKTLMLALSSVRESIADFVQGNSTLPEMLGAIWERMVSVGTLFWGRFTKYISEQLPIWQANLLEWANASWQWIVDAIPVVRARLGEWGTALTSWLSKALPSFLEAVLKWGTALYTWVGDALPKAIDALAGFVRGLREKGEGEGSNELSTMVRGWAGTLWQWIQNDVIPKVGPALMDMLRAMLTYGQRMVVSLGNLASELGQTLWAWIVEITPIAVKKLGDWGSELWGWIKEKAPVWRDHLAAWAGIAWKWITETAIPEATKKLGEWGTALWEWVKTNAPTWRDRLGEWAKAAWEWITLTAIPEALIKLGEWGTALQDWVTENAPKWAEKFTDAGLKMMLWLRDSIEIGWIRLTDWFFSDTAFGGFVGDILDLFGVQLAPAHGVFYEHGKKIVYSLNDGSRYGLDALRQTGSDMGSAMSSGLQTNLDMHSPSRVMWGFGQDIMAGLQGGVRAGIAGLRSEMQYVADEIAASMKRANDDMLASIDYFTNQAAAKALAAHNKIANSVKDTSAFFKQLGIDPSKAVGFGPNGELILPGINKLPNGGKGTAKASDLQQPSNIGNFVPLQTEITTLGEALGTNTATAQAAAQSVSLLGGLNLQVVDLAQAKENINASIEQSSKTLKDFIAGIGDFLEGTLTGANSVFRFFNQEELKAQTAGTLKDFMGSETAQTKNQLKGLYQGLQNSIADILGISTNELNVTGTDSKRLIDRITQLTSGTNAESNMEYIGKLLQTAADFRNLSNFGTGREYYANVLPTDTRLTGNNTTNEFNITVQGSSNQSADVLGLVDILRSLYGTAPA